MNLDGPTAMSRDEIKRKLPVWLTQLCAAKRKRSETPVTPEYIAVRMGVSYNAVKNWMAGRKTPRAPTVAQLEHLFGRIP